ncbi:arginine--tRNA ligase [Candidatus Saccharibacteria bacterium]|nr:MAG: arginine--tRNA ligase [Candidatus Saccharibacteria bacterium]
MEPVQTHLQKVVKDLFAVEVAVDLTRPDAEFGDYATNVAMQLSKQLGKNPREVAQQIADALNTGKADLGEVSIAGPGFINLRLIDKAVIAHLKKATTLPQTLAGQTSVVEYSDPNPFKVLHVGHLYDSVVGESIARLQEAAGAKVHRVNFGGDVGLHVGKTMWAVLQYLGGENPEELYAIPQDERAVWLSNRYVEGSNAYEDNQEAHDEIVSLNQRVYQLHADNDHGSPFAQIYWTTRQWSYEYFDAFYDRIGTKFEKYYPESITAPVGIAAVREQLKNGVFKESDGAVVFDGEAVGLHTRVFINSAGLPTYEAKDIGLALCKWQDYQFDQTVIITGNDIVEYMKVILAALGQFQPKLAERTTHITHGMVKMSGGVKMSSRKGNILRAVDVLDMTTEAFKASGREANESITQGAIKYAFLKARIGGDIHFNVEESVSMEGNSGPYLQYAHARAQSILHKTKTIPAPTITELVAGERALAVKLTEYADVVTKATKDLTPHVICTYLYELTQEFNRFYEKNRVIDDEREAERLYLVKKYATILKKGLQLLGIDAPGQM